MLKPQDLILSAAVPQTETPAFKNWFADSKVTTHNGLPLVVYHGTDQDFHSFDATLVGSRHVDVEAGPAIFFSNDKETANWYAIDSAKQRKSKKKCAESAAHVMPVYLSMQNPLIVDFKGEGLEFLEGEINNAKEGGHDGLIAIDYDDGGVSTHYVAFTPSQVKSALGNNGDFDAANTDIRFSLTDQVEQPDTDAPCP